MTSHFRTDYLLIKVWNTNPRQYCRGSIYLIETKRKSNGKKNIAEQPKMIRVLVLRLREAFMPYLCCSKTWKKTFNSRVFVESTTPGREHTHTHLIALTIDRSDWIISEISRGKRPYFPVPFLNGSFHFFKWRTVQVLSLVTGLFSAHVPMLIHHPQLQHPKGMFTSQDIFPASLNT